MIEWVKTNNCHMIFHIWRNWKLQRWRERWPQILEFRGGEVKLRWTTKNFVVVVVVVRWRATSCTNTFLQNRRILRLFLDLVSLTEVWTSRPWNAQNMKTSVSRDFQNMLKLNPKGSLMQNSTWNFLQSWRWGFVGAIFLDWITCILYTHHVRLWWDWGQRFWREVDSHGVLRDKSLLQVDLICWSNCSTPGDGWTGRWLAWRSWTNAAFAGSKIEFLVGGGRALSNLKGHIFLTAFSLEINWFGTFLPWKVPKENAQGVGRKKPVELKEFVNFRRFLGAWFDDVFFWDARLERLFMVQEQRPWKKCTDTTTEVTCIIFRLILWTKHKKSRQTTSLARKQIFARGDLLRTGMLWEMKRSYAKTLEGTVRISSSFTHRLEPPWWNLCRSWQVGVVETHGCIDMCIYIYTHSIYIYLYFPMNQTWCIFLITKMPDDTGLFAPIHRCLDGDLHFQDF